MKKGSFVEYNNHDSFTVSSLVKDPEVIRKYLVETERVMSDLMAKALLDATINMEGLLNLTGNIDFKGIVCNSTRFGKYLLFKDESTQASIADQLCRLNSSKIPEIVDYVQKQIDVAKIMKIIAHMAELGGNYTISKGFNDLADIIALGNQVSDANMPNLNHLAKWIKDVGQFVERSVNVSKTDFAGLGFILQTLDPIIQKFSPDSPTWNETRKIMSLANKLMKWYSQESVRVPTMQLTFGNMFGKSIKLQEFLKKTLQMTTDSIVAMGTATLNLQKFKAVLDVIDNSPDKPVALHRAFCVDPGFVSMWTFTPGTDVQQLRRYQAMICRMNITELVKEFSTELDVDAIMQQVASYQSKPFQGSMNWTDVVFTAKTFIEKLIASADLFKPLFEPLSKISLENLWSQFEKLIFNNGTSDMNSLSPMMAEIMVMIDQQMKGSPQYAAVVSWMTLDYIINKHILNVVDKISVNGLRLKDLFTNSIAVRSVLTRALSLTPELIDILLDSIVHPHKLVAVLLKIELNSTKSICDGTISVTSFLTFKEPMIVGMLEKSICDNWQRIVSELKNEPIVKEVDDWLKNQKNTSWIDSKMNITDYFYDYIAISEKVMNLNLMNKPIFPESQINTTHIMTSVQAFAKEMSAYDWKKLETDLTKIADTMNNSPNLFSTETNSIISLASTVHKLINKQLNVLNKAQVYSYELMGSSELNKIMNVVATMGPDVISVAGYSVLSWLQDPAKVVQIASLQQPLTLCTDAALFQKIFTASPYRPVNLVDLQQKLCRLMATVNITLLAEQLVDYGGFQKQIQQAMTSTSKVNFTNIVTEALSTKNLVENLINNPPNVMSLPAQLQDSQEWLKVVNTLKLSYDKILDILQSVNWMSILLEPKVTQMLQEQINNLKLNSVFNEMNKILPAINDQLKQIIGKNLPFNRWFARYPQLFKVVSSMDQLPSAIAVIIASDQRPDLMNALFSKVNTTNFPLMICNPSVISQYLVVPMRARSDFYVFMQKLCSLNVTELYMELASTVGLNPYKLMPSENPVDVFKLMKNIISMQQIIQNITMSPPQSSLPMWLDPKSWDIVLIQMHERAMQSPNATDVFIRHIMLMYASYFDRVVKAYDLGAFVNLETVLFKRINAYLKSLLTLDSPSPDSLELMKVAGLIKYMPVIMHTVLRTSLYKSSEITKSILDKTILQKLCGPDPSSVLSIPMNVDIKPALKIICQLNFTKITDDFDYNSLLSPLLNNNATSTNQANVTELIATVFEYTNLLTAINQRLAAGTLWKMPIWMEPRQMQTLAAVMWGELEKYSSNAQKNIMNSLNNPALIQALSDAKEVQPILNAMNAAIPTAVQRIDSLAGKIDDTC
ncbi:uncharacterized protein LOC141903514 [Tubulanus polymorphus]|uniref:uncharacterized protein LOC141903514 n=1 Tax=Tubulanus polymorphus TaxID=672921 RepID=UPI003DA3EC64